MLQSRWGILAVRLRLRPGNRCNRKPRAKRLSRADEEDIKATHDKGILTVDVALPEQAAAAAANAEKHITVQAAS